MQRTGAACQLHWKTMKNIQNIREHIKYIKQNHDGMDYHNHCDSDYDINLLINIDKVLTANQWSMSMLDTLWESVQKECVQKEDTLSKAAQIDEDEEYEDDDERREHKKSKRKKKKKHKKKKHRHHNHKNKERVDEIIDECEDLMLMNGKKVSSRSNARWTVEEEQILIQMLAQSNDMQEIAKKLGRSIPAINQHRLSMKHKHAKYVLHTNQITVCEDIYQLRSLNDSSEEDQNTNNAQKRKSNSGSDNESSSDDSDDDEANIRRQENVSKAVMTPIITPNSYVSSNAMHMQHMSHTLNSNLNRLNQTEAYNADYSANMSSTTTSSANTAGSNQNGHNPQNGNMNPFKSMPIFSVNNKRSLSVSSTHINGHMLHHRNGNGHMQPPPQKKARLCAMRPTNPLLGMQQQQQYHHHPHHSRNLHQNSMTPIPLMQSDGRNDENIALPSLNTSFQTR